MAGIRTFLLCQVATQSEGEGMEFALRGGSGRKLVMVAKAAAVVCAPGTTACVAGYGEGNSSPELFRGRVCIPGRVLTRGGWGVTGGEDGPGNHALLQGSADQEDACSCCHRRYVPLSDPPYPGHPGVKH
jgi:hypothetical protein